MRRFRQERTICKAVIIPITIAMMCVHIRVKLDTPTFPKYLSEKAPSNIGVFHKETYGSTGSSGATAKDLVGDFAYLVHDLALYNSADSKLSIGLSVKTKLKTTGMIDHTDRPRPDAQWINPRKLADHFHLRHSHLGLFHFGHFYFEYFCFERFHTLFFCGRILAFL
jgi:hypothetical protein